MTEGRVILSQEVKVNIVVNGIEQINHPIVKNLEIFAVAQFSVTRSN